MVLRIIKYKALLQDYMNLKREIEIELCFEIADLGLVIKRINQYRQKCGHIKRFLNSLLFIHTL